MWTDTASILFFYCVVLGVGIWASQKRRKQIKSQKISGDSSHEIFLANRQLPLWVGVLTMTATWVGGGYINGTAEAVYQDGLSWAQAPWGYSFSLVLGGLFFAKKMRQGGHTTFLDPFEKRLGKEVTALLFIPALIGEIFWSASILTALGFTFSTITGLDFQTAVLVSAAFATAYTLLGGLWAVAYTDVIQLIFISFGLCLSVPFALNSVGGLEKVITQYHQHFADSAGFFPPSSAWTDFLNWNQDWSQKSVWGKQIMRWCDLMLLLVLGGIPWNSYFQRVLSSSSPKSAVQLSYFAAVLCFLMAIPSALLGAAAVSADWATILGGGAAPRGAMVLPYVLHYLTPHVVAVLGLGVVAAAVMSSIDSSILSASSMFTLNVYKPFRRTKPSEKHLAHVVRFSIIAVAIISSFLALRVKSVYALWFLCSDLVYVLLFPQLVLLLYSKWQTKGSVIAGLLVGLFLRLGGGEDFLGIPAFIAYPMNDPELGLLFPYRTVAMLGSLLTTILVSQLQLSSLRNSQKRAELVAKEQGAKSVA
ncbi:MAG: sodium:solute symporter family protein [Oligoflexales bacterium]|nr:sodium:solute symporter family protein [Oligoflexales bacterium]